MKKYEVLFIINSELAEDVIKSEITKVQDFLTKNKAANISVDEWGVKKFAYPINFKNEGYYVLIGFEAEANVPNELEHQLNLNEKIFRNLITTKEM